MDARKCQRLHSLGRSDDIRRLIAVCAPSTKLPLLVEEKITGSLAVLHSQCSESLIVRMKLHHASEIDRTDHVDVVQNERRFLLRMPARIP